MHQTEKRLPKSLRASGENKTKEVERGVKGMDRISVTQPGHNEIASSTSLYSVYLCIQQAGSVSNRIIAYIVGATLAVALENRRLYVYTIGFLPFTPAVLAISG